MKRSLRRISLLSSQRPASKSCTSPAIVVSNPVVSKPLIVLMPLLPSISDCHVFSRPVPTGVTHPRPVTTTRGRPFLSRKLTMSRRSPALRRLVLIDVLDRVADGLDVFGFLVRDFDLELFLHRHDELDDVE